MISPCQPQRQQQQQQRGPIATSSLDRGGEFPSPPVQSLFLPSHFSFAQFAQRAVLKFFLPPGANPKASKCKQKASEDRRGRTILGVNRDGRAAEEGGLLSVSCVLASPSCAAAQWRGAGFTHPSPLLDSVVWQLRAFERAGSASADSDVQRSNFAVGTHLPLFRFCCFASAVSLLSVLLCQSRPSPIPALVQSPAVTWPAIYSRAIYRLPVLA